MSMQADLDDVPSSSADPDNSHGPASGTRHTDLWTDLTWHQRAVHSPNYPELLQRTLSGFAEAYPLWVGTLSFARTAIMYYARRPPR